MHGMTLVMVVFFGLGTLVTNLLPLLATDEARAELGHIPYALFWYLTLMALGYLATGLMIALRRAGALDMAWSLAILHSVSASLLWMWFFWGNPVEQATLIMELLREGFWVLIGIYLWKYPGALRPPKFAPQGRAGKGR